MVKLTCNKCKHNWEYKGKNPYYATCPYCLGKVKVTVLKENIEQNKRE